MAGAAGGPLSLDEGGEARRAGGEEEGVGVHALPAADHEGRVAAPKRWRNVAGRRPLRRVSAEVEEAPRRGCRVLGRCDHACRHRVPHHPLGHRPKRVPERGAAGHRHRVPGAWSMGRVSNRQWEGAARVPARVRTIHRTRRLRLWLWRRRAGPWPRGAGGAAPAVLPGWTPRPRGPRPCGARPRGGGRRPAAPRRCAWRRRRQRARAGGGPCTTGRAPPAARSTPRPGRLSAPPPWPPGRRPAPAATRAAPARSGSPWRAGWRARAGHRGPTVPPALGSLPRPPRTGR